MTNSDEKSRNSSRTSYETTLGYLEYGSASDRISIPIRIRERHLTPDASDVVLQATGIELQATIFSERQDLVVRVPLREWETTDGYEVSLHGPNGGHISVGTFEENLANDGDEIPAAVYPTTVIGP